VTRWSHILVLLAACLLAACLLASLVGCGQSEKDKYIDAYKPVNDRLLKVGTDIGTAVQSASTASDAGLAKKFDGLASRLETVKKDVDGLDTPADLKDESKALSATLAATTTDLRDISTAAKEKDGQGAATATLQLSKNAQTVNTAQNKLAKATGAKIGGR
jgi:hypothetical protein